MQSTIAPSTPYIVTKLDGESFVIYWHVSPKDPLTICYQAGKEKQQEVTFVPDGSRWMHIECGPGPLVVTVGGEDPIHCELARGEITLEVKASQDLRIQPDQLFIGHAPNGDTGFRARIGEPLDIPAGETVSLQAQAVLASFEAILYQAGSFFGGNDVCQFTNTGLSIGHFTLFEDSAQPFALTSRDAVETLGFVTEQRA